MQTHCCRRKCSPTLSKSKTDSCKCVQLKKAIDEQKSILQQYNTSLDDYQNKIKECSQDIDNLDELEKAARNTIIQNYKIASENLILTIQQTYELLNALVNSYANCCNTT